MTICCHIFWSLLSSPPVQKFFSDVLLSWLKLRHYLVTICCHIFWSLLSSPPVQKSQTFLYHGLNCGIIWWRSVVTFFGHSCLVHLYRSFSQTFLYHGLNCGIIWWRSVVTFFGHSCLVHLYRSFSQTFLYHGLNCGIIWWRSVVTFFGHSCLVHLYRSLISPNNINVVFSVADSGVPTWQNQVKRCRWIRIWRK